MVRSGRGASLAATPSGPGRHARYLHELGTYASDEEFLALISPFALEGLAQGEPVIFAYDPAKMTLLQRSMPRTAGITYVTDTTPYATPAKALAGWRDVAEQHLAAGARRVRIAGDVPHPGYGRSYAGWDRYESAFDHVMGDLPVWAPCLYDTRIAPASVLESATRHHHGLYGADGAHRDNGAYVPPGGLADFLAPTPDPFEATSPHVELHDPSPAETRAAVLELGEPHLAPGVLDDLVLATSEAITNAIVHGTGPRRVRMWAGARRVVVHVHDEGQGPADPFAGLRAVGDGSLSGRGLWLAHLLAVDLALLCGAGGFTVRICAGAVCEG